MNATVSLPISELDGLRDSIKQLTLDNQKLSEGQQSIKIELKITENSYGLTRNHWSNSITDSFNFQRKEEVVLDKIQFFNLSELQQNFKLDAQQLVQKEIDILKSTNNNKDALLSSLKDNHEKAIIKLGEDCKHKLEEQAKVYEVKIERNNVLIFEFENKIKELEGIEVEKGKDAKISNLENDLVELQEKFKELSKELSAEKKKKWYQKF